MTNPVVLSFLFFLVSFIVVGSLSVLERQSTTEDYLVASRSVKPWAVALSAAATNNSGYMFIGLIGYVYAVGVSGSWLMVGWIGGDYMAWHWIHRRLRERSHEQGAVTIPSFSRWRGDLGGTILEKPRDGVRSGRWGLLAARIVSFVSELVSRRYLWSGLPTRFESTVLEIEPVAPEHQLHSARQSRHCPD